MKISNLLFVLAFLFSNFSIQAQDYGFYGYSDTLWTNPTNWEPAYAGTTIDAGKYARVASNWSLGRCSLDVDIINNGRLLLQSRFFYNSHTITNNGQIEMTGTVWGDMTNESMGEISPGWEPFFYARSNLQVYGSITSSGKMSFDFKGTDNTWDSFNTTSVNLGGEIEIRFRDGFVPNIGQEYTILSTGVNGVNGTFATETWPVGTAGTIIYETNRVKLVVISTLPVELTKFDAVQQDENALLTWTTAAEINNLGFAVEKSFGNGEWKRIGFVEGNGTTNNISEYDFMDKNIFSGTNYYRLKQTDYDGKVEYSDVVALDFSGLKPDINVFPNPSERDVKIRIDNPSKRRMKISVSDYLGRMIWDSGLIEGEIFWIKEFEFEKNGTYFVTVEIGNEVYFDRIIVMDEN